MKRPLLTEVAVFAGTLLLLVLPAVLYAQAGEPKQGPPPIEQPLVREGALAVKLLFALAVGATEDEAEAESRLGEVGIAPRNGWIADYPVTPDIAGELEEALTAATEAGRLMTGKEEALKRYHELLADLGIAVRPYSGEKPAGVKPPGAENYPNPTVINNYYYNQGPPVVTYYAPPPDYYYLYSWVPSPFWCFGFWFPGFFILNDFHRTVIINSRVVFVSNHFNDVRSHRVFRIDPVSRYRGRTFAGIGVTGTRGFIQTGVPRSERRIFNGPRTRPLPAGRVVSPPPRGGGAVTQPSPRTNRAVGQSPSRGGRQSGPSPRSGGTVRPRSGEGGNEQGK
jgi:hypothetical protein